MPCRGKRTQPGATPWVMDRIQRCALQGQKIKINAMKRDLRHESLMMGKDGTESQLRTTPCGMTIIPTTDAKPSTIKFT